MKGRMKNCSDPDRTWECCNKIQFQDLEEKGVRDGRGYERESRRGYMPQRAGEKYSGRKRFEIYLLFVCVLLVVDILFTMQTQIQMKNMNKALNQVLSTLAVNQQEAGIIKDGEADLMASRETDEVINPKYQAAPNADTQEPEQDEVDYVSLCGLPFVDKPVDRTPNQIQKRLEELAEDKEVIAEIYRNSSRYPEDMLDALANNPEMADFVDHFLTSDTRPTGRGLTKAEKQQEYPLFLQWDPRWGYVEYGDGSNIGLAGCGPTCLSMMLYYLLGDENITPDVIAEYSMENGYYMSGTGTAWKLLEDVAAVYGVSVDQPKASEKTLKNALDQGEIVICSMKPGDFTAGGHFVVIYGYDEEGFLINDPNCVARSRQRWTYEEIGRQIKHTWVYGKGSVTDYYGGAAGR